MDHRIRQSYQNNKSIFTGTIKIIQNIYQWFKETNTFLKIKVILQEKKPLYKADHVMAKYNHKPIPHARVDGDFLTTYC